MKYSEKIVILDDAILSLEFDQEKAKLMAGNISQDYFDLDDNQSKLLCFNKTRIEFDILFDYIAQMGNKLNEVRKMIREWDKPCKEEGGAPCQSK